MENDTLFWHGDQVWPERLRLLRDQHGLRRLILWGGSLTSDKLDGLEHLTQLTAVAIGECPMDNGVFAHLQPLGQLAFLNLSHTEVSGGFAKVAAAPVGEIVLEGCLRLGDEALCELAALQTLRRLVLRNTGATARAIADFRRTRPDCEVIV